MNLEAAWWAQGVTYIIFVFGLCIGSFLNVCILRIPEGSFLQSMRSRCPHCKAQIPFYLNIPVFSWLMLAGRARCCGKKISWQYPAVEMLTALMFVAVYWHYPFVVAKAYGFTWDPVMFISCIHMLIFTALMIVVSVIDLRLQIIPDVLSYPMIALSVFWMAVHPQLDWFSSLMGIIVGGGVLWLVAWIYYLVRNDYGLGFGDVKLLAAIGGWLGVEAVMPGLFYGSLLGAIIGIGLMVFTKDTGLKSKLPFGPFLALGSWVHMLYGTEVMSFILGANL